VDVPLTHAVIDRWLRERLLQLRDGNGLSQDEAAKRSGISHRTLLRIENGQTSIDPDILDDLLVTYNVEPAQHLELQRLRKLSIRTGWWNDYADVIGARYAEHCELEELADEIQSWTTTLVDGLLQTEQYSRMVQGATLRWLEKSHAERFARLRLDRQRHALRKDRPFRCLLDEAALLRGRARNRKLMQDQLDHLKRADEEGLAEIRVLPMSEPIYVGGSMSCFIIGTRRVVCFDGLIAEEHSEVKEIVDSFASRFDSWWRNDSVPIGDLTK